MSRILLVEDNETICLGLQFLLTKEGYEVSVANSMEEAEQVLGEQEFMLALLDISLPDGDGFALCKRIKESKKLPVIFLTAREEEGDVVKGFDLGADDYVIKPFRNRGLVSRIKNVLRRSGHEKDDDKKLLRCGDITLHMETGKVTHKGGEVLLTKMEFRILTSMMGHPGKIFTREELLSGAWDLYGNYVNDNTLSVTMKRIREKLGDTEGQRIQTVQGIGYRMEG